MNLTFVIGIVLAWVMVIMAIVIGAGFGIYVDSVSILIVVGGSAGVIISKFSKSVLFGVVKSIKVAMKPNNDIKPKLIASIVTYAVTARKSGVLSLEKTVEGEDNPFLKKGLNMVIDGNEPDTIKEVLEMEINFISARHNNHIEVFASISDIAGAMGMIGTLIGLVAMLVNMADPSSIGPAMAVAILTTLYGSLIGNMIANPLGEILKGKNQEEIFTKKMILMGILLIQAGDNPRNLEEKLLIYLEPKKRVSQYEW